MVKTQYIAALEIGSSKIVGAIAEKSPSGYLEVRNLEVERLINSVRHGCILLFRYNYTWILFPQNWE